MLISFIFASFLHKCMWYVMCFVYWPNRFLKLTIRNFNRIVTNDLNLWNSYRQEYLRKMSISSFLACKFHAENKTNNNMMTMTHWTERQQQQHIQSCIRTRNAFYSNSFCSCWTVISFYQNWQSEKCIIVSPDWEHKTQWGCKYDFLFVLS